MKPTRYLLPEEALAAARARRNRAALAPLAGLAAIAAGLALILHFLKP